MMNTTELHFPIDNFDQVNTFNFALKDGKVRKGYIFFANDEQRILVMNGGACLKSHYTEEDYAESARLRAVTPIKTGDIVTVEGKQYTVKINGDYSNAGRLIPIE